MHLIRKRLLQNLHQAEAEEVLRREASKKKKRMMIFGIEIACSVLVLGSG